MQYHKETPRKDRCFLLEIKDLHYYQDPLVNL